MPTARSDKSSRIWSRIDALRSIWSNGLSETPSSTGITVPSRQVIDVSSWPDSASG